MKYIDNIEDCASKTPQAELINFLVERDITYDQINIAIDTIEACMHKLTGYSYVYPEAITGPDVTKNDSVKEVTFISEVERQSLRSHKILSHLRQIEDELFKVIGK